MQKQKVLIYNFLIILLASFFTLNIFIAKASSLAPVDETIQNKDELNNENIIINRTEKPMVDFNYLSTVSKNSVAWIYQEHTNFNQAIMYSRDNRYLNLNYDDRLIKSGSIYIKGENKPDFSADVIVLYGKKNENNYLFGGFEQYKNPEYYAQNPKFVLVSPEENYQLDIFAGIETSIKDKESWLVLDNSKDIFNYNLPYILGHSFINANKELLPNSKDAYALLVTESNYNYGSRYIIYARKRPIKYETKHTKNLIKFNMDSRFTQNGMIEVPNLGEKMYYAQNDPLYGKMIYEFPDSKRYRNISDGACGPTALAMAIVNVVDKDDLPNIKKYAKFPNGYSFCTCSINEYWCYKQELKYQIDTADEFLRYFPIVIANYFTGNNIWNEIGRTGAYGSSLNHIRKLYDIYNIKVQRPKNMEETLEFLRKKNHAAICSVTERSPFTENSHFIVLVGADDKYLYIFDPYKRKNYLKTDKFNVLEVVKPGFVRVEHKNIEKCGLSTIGLMEVVKPEENSHMAQN